MGRATDTKHCATKEHGQVCGIAYGKGFNVIETTRHNILGLEKPSISKDP